MTENEELKRTNSILTGIWFCAFVIMCIQITKC